MKLPANYKSEPLSEACLKRKCLEHHAPELLAACHGAAELLAKVPLIPNHEGWATTVLLQLQSAIAKAEGGES